MATDTILDRVCRETGASPDLANRVAVAVLRELHYVAATDEMVTTGALMQALWAFCAEAAYHLGGILAYHDDGTNRPDYVSESLVPETLARLVGCENEDWNAARDRWFALLAQRGAQAPSGVRDERRGSSQ